MESIDLIENDGETTVIESDSSSLMIVRGEMTSHSVRGYQFRWPRLKKISFIDTILDVEGLTAVCCSCHVEEVELYFCDMSRDVDAYVARKMTLKKLKIRGTPFQAFSQLSQNENLRELHLSDIDRYISRDEVEEIASISSLTRLEISNCRLDDDTIEPLEKMRSLLHLDLSRNVIGSMETVSKIRSLVSLKMSYNAIDWRGLKGIDRLTKLLSLNLGHNTIGEDGMTEIVKLTKLKRLNVTAAKVFNGGACLVSSLKGLEYLNLQGNRVDGSTVASIIAGCPCLINVNFRGIFEEEEDAD